MSGSVLEMFHLPLRMSHWTQLTASAAALAVSWSCASSDPASPNDPTPAGPQPTASEQPGPAATPPGPTAINPQPTTDVPVTSSPVNPGEPSGSTSMPEPTGPTSEAPSNPDAPNSWNGCEEFELPADCTIPQDAVLPGELRCTGLYANFEERQLRCGVKEYTPAFELWSDGAAKKRYVWLPPGKKVDVSDPDEFDYPIGTRFWKEFYVGPEGQQKLGETRYLLRAEAGWLYTVYVWDENGANAIQNNDGVDDLFGTGHSVPSREQCKACHQGRVNFVLGWDFIMLGEGASGVTARDLANDGLLDGLDPAWLELAAPGDAVESEALAYLHANCGISCHNTTPDATANPSGLYMRLLANFLGSPQSTDAVAAINQRPAPNAETAGIPNPELDYFDIRPLDPERSLLLARMSFRGTDAAMPPIGSHVVHQAGVDAVRAWIMRMTEDRGYPPPSP
jgi:hypothetical protein